VRLAAGLKENKKKKRKKKKKTISVLFPFQK
jgi:hypothetical protein